MTKRKKAPSESAEQSPECGQYSYVKLIAVAVTILYFLPALGIVSKNSFWAFSVNMYYPTELLIAHLMLVVIVLVLFFRPNLLRFAHKISPKYYYAIFVCALILMAFFLREAVPFYGDGYFFQKDIITNLPIKYAEVLTMLVYRAVYIALPDSAKSGASAYQIVNTTCLILAVIILLYFARRIMREYLPFVIFTFLGFGANVLFFGHIENYTLVYIAMLLYLYAITRQKPNILVLAFLLGISICLHLVALCLIPSFIYASWKMRAKDPAWHVSIISLGLFVLPFIVTVLFSFIAGMTPGRLFTEITASITTLSEHTGQNYFASIFNIHHWLDVMNLLFLGLPTFPIIALLIFSGRIDKSIWYNQDPQLILILGIPFILLIMFLNTPLGLARDWDLGVTALGWRAAAIVFLAKTRAPKFRMKPSILTSVGLLAFFLSLPWLAIHHFPQLGVRRFNDILDARTALSGTAYGYEILGRYYHDVEDYQNSVRNYEKAAQYDQLNWRRHYSVAMEYLNLKDSERALKKLRKAQELKPDEVMILMELGLLYRTMGQTDSALIMFKELYQQNKTDIMHFHNLGCAYYWAGQHKAAQDVFTNILREYPDHYNATIGLVDVMLATGDSAEAELLIERLESRYGRNQTTQKYRKTLKAVK